MKPYPERLLRILADKTEGLRPFPVPGWVHNGHWIARSSIRADGRPVEHLNAESAARFLDNHFGAAQEPLELVGYCQRPKWADGTGIGIFCRLYEGPEGVIAVDDDYAALLDGLTPVHLLTEERERSSVGGIDTDGVLWCWIMPVTLEPIAY